MDSHKMTLEEACRLIKENDKSLTRVDLSDTKVGDVGAVAVAFALKHNNFITELYLSNASVGPSGAIKLAGALKVNYTLERIYLQNNTIGDKGAEALSSALKENVSLRLLNLSRNEIGDVGVSSLAESLLGNTALHKLYLYSNNIGNIGAAALAEVVRENNTLQELFLWENKIRDEGLETLRWAYEAVKADGTRLQLYTQWKQNETSSGSQVSKPASKWDKVRAQVSRSDPENASKENTAWGKEAAEEKKKDNKLKDKSLPMAQLKSPATLKSKLVLPEGSIGKVESPATLEAKLVVPKGIIGKLKSPATVKSKLVLPEGSIDKLQQANKQEVTEDQEAVEENKNSFRLLSEALACKVEKSKEQPKPMAQKKLQGAQGSMSENGVKAKSKALATTFDKRKEQPKSGGQNSPKPSFVKNPRRSVPLRKANMPSTDHALNSSMGSLQPDNEIEVVEENNNSFRLLKMALTSKVEQAKERSRPMARGKSQGGVDTVTENGVKAKSKALAATFNKQKEQHKSGGQNSPRPSFDKKPIRSVPPRTANIPSTLHHVPDLDSSMGSLQAEDEIEVVGENENNFNLLKMALASKVEQVKEQTRPMARNKSQGGVDTVREDSVKAKSKALSTMFDRRMEQPRSVSQTSMETDRRKEQPMSVSQTSLETKTSSPKPQCAIPWRASVSSESQVPESSTGKLQSAHTEKVTEDQDVIFKGNKNGVKEKAKALAMLDKAKVRFMAIAQKAEKRPETAQESENGVKQKSQALSMMQKERTEQSTPTGTADIKSQESEDPGANKNGMEEMANAPTVLENPMEQVEGAEQRKAQPAGGSQNGVKEKARALAAWEKAKEESSAIAQSKSQPGMSPGNGVKQKSQALAMMLEKAKVHPTGLAQSKSQNPMMPEAPKVYTTGFAQSQSQNPLDSVTSREHDVVEENKNGVREKAKALAKLDKAKEESKWIAQNKSQPAMGSENGFKQKSQALSPITLEKPTVNPTGLAQSKSQNPLGSMASREQVVVEDNKNGVREKAKALAKLDKAKEESKWTAQNKSQPATGSENGFKQKSQALSPMMQERPTVNLTALAQSQSQKPWDLVGSSEQDVVEANKNGVREKAKALAKLDEAKEDSKSIAQNKSQPIAGSATGGRKKPTQGLSMMLGKSEEHSNPMAQNKWLATTSGASEKQDVAKGNKNGVRERAKALAMREEAEEFARLNDSSRSLRW